MTPPTPTPTRTTAPAGITGVVRRGLTAYLRNHDAAALGASSRLASTAGSHRDPGVRAELTALRAEVARDRASLEDVLELLGVRPSRRQRLLATVGERVGRLKPNGSLVRRSPVTDVVELEALTLSAAAALLRWRTLGAVALALPELLGVDLDGLQEQAEERLDRLEALHRRSARGLLEGRDPGQDAG